MLITDEMAWAVMREREADAKSIQLNAAYERQARENGAEQKREPPHPECCHGHVAHAHPTPR